MHFWIAIDLTKNRKLLRSETNSRIRRNLHFSIRNLHFFDYHVWTRLVACSKLSTFVTARMTRKAFASAKPHEDLQKPFGIMIHGVCAIAPIGSNWNTDTYRIDFGQIFLFSTIAYFNLQLVSMWIWWEQQQVRSNSVKNRKYCRSTCLRPISS